MAVPYNGRDLLQFFLKPLHCFRLFSSQVNSPWFIIAEKVSEKSGAYWCLLFVIFAAECRESLGMQSGEIPDDAITASSSYDAASVGPQNGR